MPLKEGNWCYTCGAYDYEPAGETCKNPPWHMPDPKVFPRDPAEKRPREEGV